jgi:hypothetical protein
MKLFAFAEAQPPDRAGETGIFSQSLRVGRTSFCF